MVITLVAVMGIAWIGNILFFDVNLIFVAYIMTVIIACQGIIIFILFVPLSKQVWTISIQLFQSPVYPVQVRDAYTKWWKIKRQQQPLLRSRLMALPESFQSYVTDIKLIHRTLVGRNCLHAK